jgi:hypothetical protein
MADGTTPKLVDLVDCTGSGNVDVSVTKQATKFVDENCLFLVAHSKAAPSEENAAGASVGVTASDGAL